MPEWSMKSIKRCQSPPVVPHARHNASARRTSFPVGTLLIYRCRRGYGRPTDGPIRVICVDEGRWVGAADITCLRNYLLTYRLYLCSIAFTSTKTLCFVYAVFCGLCCLNWLLNKYTVSQKLNNQLIFSLKLRQMLTDFQNSLTVTLAMKLEIQRSLNISPHLKHVATLPCEILVL